MKSRLSNKLSRPLIWSNCWKFIRSKSCSTIFACFASVHLSINRTHKLCSANNKREKQCYRQWQCSVFNQISWWQLNEHTRRKGILFTGFMSNFCGQSTQIVSQCWKTKFRQLLIGNLICTMIWIQILHDAHFHFVFRKPNQMDAHTKWSFVCLQSKWLTPLRTLITHEVGWTEHFRITFWRRSVFLLHTETSTSWLFSSN